MAQQDTTSKSAEEKTDQALADERDERPDREDTSQEPAAGSQAGPQTTTETEEPEDAGPGLEAPPGAVHAAGASAVTGEPPMAAWPPLAERTLVHRYLVTAPGDGDAALDLAGALPYASFSESREGPNGITWLATVSEADSANFLAQAGNCGHTVQELHQDGSGLDHVLGDEGTGWVMPGDREGMQAALDRQEEAREEAEQDEADGADGGEPKDAGDEEHATEGVDTGEKAEDADAEKPA